jgi:5-hydroxyisourate hydrolase
MTKITTHVLDTSAGHPAVGMRVKLEMQSGNSWRELGVGLTDEDGRLANLAVGKDHPSGTYRLRFAVGDYFTAQRLPTFYPSVEITFTVTHGADYHVPLLVSPFGYSTYRGS